LPSLQQLYTKHSSARWRYFVLSILLNGFRAVLYGQAILLLWRLSFPLTDSLEWIILGISGVFFFLVGLPGRYRTVSLQDYLVAAEIAYPNLKEDLFSLSDGDEEAELPSQWLKSLGDFRRRFVQSAKRKIQLGLCTLLAPIVVVLCVFIIDSGVISKSFSSFQSTMDQLTMGVSLKVLEGQVLANQPNEYSLSRFKAVEFELASENFLELQIAGLGQEGNGQVVELRNPGSNEVVQSFKFIRNSSDVSGSVKSAFSLTESVRIFIPSFSPKALANISVKKLAVPRVELFFVDSVGDEPWPDDQPLGLMIKVDSENSLDLVRLLIRSGKQESKELVSDILVSDLKKFKTQYKLILEPYLQEDLSEIEIVAEAVDKSLPSARVGRSAPLRLMVTSAYGRYRQALGSLREYKEKLDSARKKARGRITAEDHQPLLKANEQAKQSPFFDMNDRMKLRSFLRESEALTKEDDASGLITLSSEVNEFLFEHEMIDDRERDRDFFVAVRELSRLVEAANESQFGSVIGATKQINNYLERRFFRWQLRIKYLSKKNIPKMWQKVSNDRPFRTGIEKISKLFESKDSDAKLKSLRNLSEISSLYRQWLEALEKSEDKNQEEAEKKRQQGIASARNVLRELQKRQDSISKDLDKSDIKEESQLKGVWPTLRMKQNQNIKETSSLEAQLRSMAPRSSERIRYALKSMEAVEKEGGLAKFTLAEQASDMASRLLRQAQSAARQEQQSKKGSKRRRRVSGDSYYGSKVSNGGDIEIKREYQVDKRYREDILNEVSGSSHELDEQQSRTLENYLRHVVR